MFKGIPDFFKSTPAKVLLPSLLTLALFAWSVFFFILPSQYSVYYDAKRETLKELVQSVIGLLERLESMVEAGKLTREEARSMAVDQVRSIRYGKEHKDYFWIFDTSPTLIMHPYLPELEGGDLSTYRDPDSKLVFVNMLDAIDQSGSGYVEYLWQQRDQAGKIAEKLSYVQLYEPWHWVVGTGFYLDEVNALYKGYRNRLLVIFGGILLAISLLMAYILRETMLAEKRRRRIQSQREKLVTALKAGEERYRTIADFAYDWEVWLGPDNNVLYCSPSCERITGYAPETFFEKPELIYDILHEEHREAWQNYLTMVARTEGESMDMRVVTKSGETRWLCVVGRPVYGIGMKPLGYRFSYRDITDRKEMEDQLRHQALHDPLTGLANRSLSQDRIKQAMERSKRRPNYYFAVVFLDLDRFKIINDSLGHQFGDKVLVETGQRLLAHVRGLDTVSRFGGDEFVLLLDELASPGEAIRIIKRIREALAEPFVFDGHEVRTTGSFGIVLSPTHYSKPEDLLQNANIAMHRAKDAGRNHFKVFSARMLERAVDQLHLENDMRRGLERGEFYVEYQPIMHLDQARLMGFEALARWDHPDRGSIPPTEFIPMAEESGLIIELGQWVLTESLVTLAKWRAQSEAADHLFMSVNLSTRQFRQVDLEHVVLGILEQTGVPPDRLKLEITESAIMDNPDSAVRTLNNLRDAGVRFSIDDFGTGYSSLTQLQQLPVDTLKVDRSFISRMTTDPENMEIVKAVIALAHSLELDVVAEGVEAHEQLCSLVNLDCEGVQGFFFHRPLHQDDALALVNKNGGDISMSEVAEAKGDCNEKK